MSSEITLATNSWPGRARKLHKIEGWKSRNMEEFLKGLSRRDEENKN